MTDVRVKFAVRRPSAFNRLMPHERLCTMTLVNGRPAQVASVIVDSTPTGFRLYRDSYESRGMPRFDLGIHGRRLRCLEVVRPWRGSGIGPKLMRRVVQYYGHMPMYLCAAPYKDNTMPPAKLIEFYEGFGFRVIKRYRRGRYAYAWMLRKAGHR